MAESPKTIDKAGVSYAKAIAPVDQGMMQAAHLVTDLVNASALSPYVPTEFAEYLVDDRLPSYASFEAPPNYYTSSIFTTALAPAAEDSEIPGFAPFERAFDIMKGRVNQFKKG